MSSRNILQFNLIGLRMVQAKAQGLSGQIRLVEEKYHFVCQLATLDYQIGKVSKPNQILST